MFILTKTLIFRLHFTSFYGIVWLSLLLNLAPLRAQYIERSINATAGGYYQTSGFGNLHWTLGEPVVELFMPPNSTTRLSQGFHQLYALIVDTHKTNSGDFSLNAFPNPTSRTLNIESKAPSWLEWKLLDMSGKCLAFQTFATSGIQTVDLQGLPAGIYLLQVTNRQQEVRTFKVVKAP